MKMNNVSSLKSEATNSPKTPGGISKSLLTPCRRVGLSRNWRQKGPSPFISPLSGSTLEVKEEITETRKRKQRVLNDNVERTPETSNVQNEVEDDESNDIEKTPSRAVELPRRKKSKTLLAAINKSQEDLSQSEAVKENTDLAISEDAPTEVDIVENIPEVSTPVRTKSKKGKKLSPRVKPEPKASKINQISIPNVPNNEIANTDSPYKSSETIYEIKERSPHELKKECVVVIQRKIFKKAEPTQKIDEDTKSRIKVTEQESNNTKLNKEKQVKSSSQTLFDSDSDDTPLIQINNKSSSKSKLENIIEPTQTDTRLGNKNDFNEDDDFIDKSVKTHVSKVKDSKSPKSKLKTSKTTKVRNEKVKEQPKPPSQSSYDDDDDFENSKKTILIRKTYEKVSKPSKAKSTGSITQKDVDELKARIETKKKLLLAQSINPETEELRSLIKKWQKGCQSALIELLDLMKTKFHDNQDMDYAEMLETLKIPPSLVGYDAENDCFNEPNDADIILGQFQDV